MLESNTFEQTLSIKQDPEICKIRDTLEKAKINCMSSGIVLYIGKLISINYYFMYQNQCYSYMPRRFWDYVGINNVLTNIIKVYWFPSIREEIKVYIKNCLKYIESRHRAESKKNIYTIF